MDKTYLNRT